MVAIARQTRRFFWQIDPGYFRLKLAFKTVLAIVISLWWTNKQDLTTQLMACTATGFSMQGVVAKDFSRRVVQILILSFSYFSAFMIGLWSRDSVLYSSIVLAILAFTVNYCRRFNLRNSIAPMMIWMLCFLAMILPLPSVTETLNHVDGLIKGLIVSACVLLLVWPENYKRLFRQNTNFYFSILHDQYRFCAHWLSTLLTNERVLPAKEMQLELSYPLESNQALERSQTLTRNNPHMLRATTKLHALNQAFFLLVEALLGFKRRKELLPKQLISLIIDLLDQASRLFDNLRMNKKLQIRWESSQLISMKKLNLCLAELDITEPPIILTIMNLKMAFQLINQHLQDWVSLNEDA